MIPKVTIDDRSVRRNLTRLSTLQGKPIQQLTNQSARRFAVNLSRATVPFGFGSGLVRRSEKVIEADVSRVFITPGKLVKEGTRDEDERKQLVWGIRNMPPATLSRLVKDITGEDITASKSSAAKLRQEMQKTRTRRGGQPRYQKPRKLIDTEKRTRLLRKLAKRIGLAKYGWAVCARRIGGARGIPQWVKSSKGVSSPQSVGAVSFIRRRGFYGVELINRVRYASFMIFQKDINRSFQRESDFLAQEVDRRIQATHRRR